MPEVFHVRGCRYEGTPQECGSTACLAAMHQAVRVLLTDASLILAGVDHPSRDVWQENFGPSSGRSGRRSSRGSDTPVMPSVRFRIHERQGKAAATLAGVDQRDLRTVFDAAAINYYDQLSKLRKKQDKKKLDRQELEELAFVQHMLKVLDSIKAATDGGIRATWRDGPGRTLTKKERWEKVRAAKKEREFLDSIVISFLDESVKRKAARAQT